MAETILVDRRSGYVGSVVVAELLERDYEVRALDVLAHGSVPSLLPAWGNKRFTSSTVTSATPRPAARRSRALTRSFTWRQSSAIRPVPGAGAGARGKPRGTRALVRDSADAGAERFIFASTCSNYGRTDKDGFVDEKGELKPISLYAETKVGAEREGSPSNGSMARTLPAVRDGVRSLAQDALRPHCQRIHPRRFDSGPGSSSTASSSGARTFTCATPRGAIVLTSSRPPRKMSPGTSSTSGDTRENYRKLDIVTLMRGALSKGTFEYVAEDEDPRDYRVSFHKFADRLGFDAARTVGDGIDELRLGALRSGLHRRPYATSTTN